MKTFLSFILVIVALAAVSEELPSSGSIELPPGHVQGDVISYSYVPNRYWTIEEGKGILPYLCEYGSMRHQDDVPLEAFHEENIRRIDLVSQWSTVLMLYVRHPHYIDEIINLMLRGYRHRQFFACGSTGEKKTSQTRLGMPSTRLLLICLSDSGRRETRNW